MHSVRVPMWQTQSVGPVRTAHVSVLMTVNIVSHNPAKSSSDNIPSWPPDNHHNSDVVYRRGRGQRYGQTIIDEAITECRRDSRPAWTFVVNLTQISMSCFTVKKRDRTVFQLNFAGVTVVTETHNLVPSGDSVFSDNTLCYLLKNKLSLCWNLMLLVSNVTTVRMPSIFLRRRANHYQSAAGTERCSSITYMYCRHGK